MQRWLVLALGLSLGACGGGTDEEDAGADAGSTRLDGGDGGSLDGGPPAVDAGEPDGGARDGGARDGGVLDGGPPDGGPPDGGDADGGPADGGPSDAGLDAGPGFDAGAGTTFPPRDFVCPSGVAPPCLTTAPLRSAAARTVAVTTDMPTTTLTYVISVLQMPEPTATTAAGFNLDGLDSGAGSTSPTADCEQFNPDYDSVLDPGHVGVDNAFGSLIPTVEGLLDASSCGGTTAGCIDYQLAQSIADGTMLLLIEIAGVESVVHDPDVTVTLYVAEVPGGGVPTLDASGRLAPGQTFATVSTAAGPVTSDIFHGRLRAPLGSVTFPMGSGLPLVPGTFSNAELRVDVALTSLSDGHMGGSTPVNWFVNAAEAIMPGIGPTVRSVVESISDIQPTTADPFVCADVSSALTLSAVPATRTP